MVLFCAHICSLSMHFLTFFNIIFPPGRFETIDAAEKCIQSLRRFRNLHPTFSKVSGTFFFVHSSLLSDLCQQQVHKIPGTTYAQAPSISSSHSASSVDHGDDGSFKAKMERLHDPNSTNLYIEG